MRSILKTMGNAALVVAGFFVVFFSVAKIVGQDGRKDRYANDGVGVAHADAPGTPYSQASYGYSQGSYK
jgi:hypothetical protein